LVKYSPVTNHQNKITQILSGGNNFTKLEVRIQKAEGQRTEEQKAGDPAPNYTRQRKAGAGSISLLSAGQAEFRNLNRRGRNFVKKLAK